MTDDVITLGVTWEDILWQMLSRCGSTIIFYVKKNVKVIKLFLKIALKDSGRFFNDNYNLLL